MYLLLLVVLLALVIYYKLVLSVKLFGKSLAGLNVLVTGAGSGIGKALCLALAHEKCNVIICVDINDDANKETKKEVLQESKNTVTVEALVCDVSSFESVQKLANHVHEKYGHVDILVNNAGVGIGGRFLNFSEHELRKTVDVNLMAQFWAIKAFLPHMLKRNSGHIVTTASVASKLSMAGIAAYCATKHAVYGYMQALNLELKIFHNNQNIKLTTVLPYVINTGLADPKFIEKDRFLTSFVISPKSAAAYYLDGIKLELTWFTIPRFFSFALELYNYTPDFILLPFFSFLSLRLVEGMKYKTK